MEGAVDVGVAAGIVVSPSQQIAAGDDQRHRRGRQEEEHRHEDQLGRDRIAVGDVEFRPAADDVRADQDRQGGQLQGPRRRQQKGHPQRDGKEAQGKGHLDQPLDSLRAE
jgi:hypothetical protein